MFYVQVVSGIVTNRAVFDAEMPLDWPDRANWIASEEAQIGWEYVDGLFVPPTPLEAPSSEVAPHLNNSGLVRFTGASPTTVNEAIRVLGVTRIAKGRYRALHETPMPSDQYSATASVMDPSPRLARVTARTTTYVEVRVTDLLGVAQDPAEVTIETQRVIYPS